MTSIRSDLRERFDYAAYFYLSAWESDPDANIVDNVIVREEAKEDAEERLVQAFEKLRDGVDAIPEAVIAKTEGLRASVGQDKYERILGDALVNVVRQKLSVDATAFVQSLNLSLQLAA